MMHHLQAIGKRGPASQGLVDGAFDENSDWDISKEREFMEDLVQSRFNFLLVVFGLAIAGGGQAKGWLQPTTFFLGSILCFLLSRTVARAHSKLKTILDAIYELGDKDQTRRHPVHLVDRALKESQAKIPCKCWIWLSGEGESQVDAIGVFIPWACTLVLLALAIATQRFPPVENGARSGSATAVSVEQRPNPTSGTGNAQNNETK